MGKRLGPCGLMLALLLGWSGLALAQDATVYELTENMKLISKHKTERRKATSEIMGFVKPGTPICPVGQPVPGRDTVCTINITASDNISLATGLGTLRGRYTVVVQDQNSTDSPEFVVSRGNFRGDMDFSPAILGGNPFGTVVGRLDPDGHGHHDRVGFTGTFFLPFTLPVDVDPSGTVYYLDFNPDNPYHVVPVAANEMALGYATVKFEITFH